MADSQKKEDMRRRKDIEFGWRIYGKIWKEGVWGRDGDKFVKVKESETTIGSSGPMHFDIS